MQNGARSCYVEVWQPGDPTLTGEANPVPVLFKSVWASLIPMRGREREMDRDRQAITVYHARLDYLDGVDIKATMQVRFEGFTFNILSVKIDFTTRKTVDLVLQEQTFGA
jgi:head-tail adaptor